MFGQELNAMVTELFEINTKNNNEFKGDVYKEVEEHFKIKNEMIKSKLILNNSSYKMSELDMEIIYSIPQGGNWKNIPQHTINKSKRFQLTPVMTISKKTTNYKCLRGLRKMCKIGRAHV